MNGEFTGVDISICKGTWEFSQYDDVGRYLLCIGEALLKEKDQKVKAQEKYRFDKAKQIECKRSIEYASLKMAEKSTATSTWLNCNYVSLLTMIIVL